MQVLAELPPSARPSMGGRLLPTGCPSHGERYRRSNPVPQACRAVRRLTPLQVSGPRWARQTDGHVVAGCRGHPQRRQAIALWSQSHDWVRLYRAYEILRSRVEILHAGWAWKAELTLQADHQDAGTRRRSPYSDEEVDALIGAPTASRRLPGAAAQGPDRPRRRPRRPLGQEDLSMTGTTSGHRAKPRTGASFASTRWRRWRNP
jgi:hypothetical protein